MTISLRIGLWMAISLMWGPAARADVESGRDVGRAHYQRGVAQYELDHYQQAIAEFEAGFAAAPEPAFLFNLAIAHAKLGHKQEALRFYRKYLDHGVPAAEVEHIEEAIHQLELELQPPAPVAAPSPMPAPELVVRAAPAPKKRRLWPIAVGVAAAGVAAAVIIGLSVGLTRPGEPVIDWSAR